jgi:signal transduction histidine kinase
VLYGALFLASGAALLTVTYFLVAHRYRGNFFVVAGRNGLLATGDDPGQLGGTASVTATGLSVGVLAPSPAQIVAAARSQTNAALHQLLIQSGLALAVMTVLSVWLGWLVAGRVLQPLRTIANAAREISASDLHRRLALTGPDDELTQLGSTFDGLLERLEASFEAQRQFVANASHELRTPLTYERTLLEVALADPDVTVDSLRATCERLLENGEQQERLIEALLTLSRGQRGLDHRERLDMAAIVTEGVRGVGAGTLKIETRLQPARTSGDRQLLERLVANLLSNAVHHNVPNGRIRVATETRSGRPWLSVENTGPFVPTEEIDRLFRPFQRLEAARAANPSGTGLGLSIVHAIAAAHDAEVAARPRAGGGLQIEVVFPPAAKSEPQWTATRC